MAAQASTACGIDIEVKYFNTARILYLALGGKGNATDCVLPLYYTVQLSPCMSLGLATEFMVM